MPLSSSISAHTVDQARALRVSEARYRRLFETAQDGILLLNAETAQIEDVNRYLIEMLGYTHQEFLGKKLWEVGPFADIAQSKDMFAEVQANGYVRYENLPLRTRAGALINIEVVANSYDCEGIKVIQCNIRDITDRKLAEAQAHRHMALYATLSQCNHTIVHSTTEQELFPEICRIAVEFGGAEMAWVGMVDVESGAVRPVASCGDANGYLIDIAISVRDDSPYGRGPIGRAIRENRPFWINDIAHDPLIAPWRERIAPSGWTALAALPLCRGGRAIGVLCVYEANAPFVDEAGRGLLRELATDISFALDGFAREAHRKRAEEALRARESEFHTMAEAVPQIVWVSEADGMNIFFNQRWVDYTGLTLEESRGDGWIKAFHPDEQQQIWGALHTATAAVGVYSHEHRLRRADGVYRWWLVRGVPHKDESASTINKWFGTCTDINDLKTAEIKIRRLNRVHSVLSGINALIVHVTDRDTLFSEACRIAVEVGGFRMSLVSLVDPDTTKIVPVATASKDEALVAEINFVLSSPDDPHARMIAQVARERAIIIASDDQNDAGGALAGKESETRVRSVAVFPLIVADAVMGVLALYAEESNFFDEDEMALLTELVGDIAFAIDHIGNMDRLNHLAYYDELTGLANRRLFLERVAQYTRGEASVGHKIAVLIFDLDRFKNINDTLGRSAGDALLKQVAEWLGQNRGDANLIARLGQDHFGIVLPDVIPGRDLARLLDDMLKAFAAEAFWQQGAALRVSATIGVALFPNDGADAEALFKHAEAALKSAKAKGARYLFYTAAMTNRTGGKLSLETRLREAFETGQFIVHYQPKVSVSSGKVTGAEALIRWNDPRSGLVAPGQFIPSLEETGLIYDVGRWALGTAVKDFIRWRAAGLAVGRIAVNVSPIQLRDPDFIAELERTVATNAHAAAGLELEITESVVMDDISQNIESLRAIRAMGLTVAIDDFGTGFSSLSYLAKLPADTLKIDRSFIIEMSHTPEGLAIVSTIISLAHGLKLKVVAEGVETDEQSRLLRLLACDEIQGFIFSRAIPAEIFEAKYLDRR